MKLEFPRIPIPRSSGLFHAMSGKGKEIVELHLLESIAQQSSSSCAFAGARKVVDVSYADGTAWLDGNHTCGFIGVPEEVWKFQIGGYQVCEKWLKDRKGRTLSKDDIEHYQKIVVAISETIRIMKEIDEVIEKHGGWPGAFVTTPVTPSEPSPSAGEASKAPAAPAGPARTDGDGGLFQLQAETVQKVIDFEPPAEKPKPPAPPVESEEGPGDIRQMDRNDIMCVIRDVFEDGDRKSVV